MDDQHIAQRLAHCRERLNPRRSGFMLREIAPAFSPDEVGAQAALALTASDPALRVHIYLFEDREDVDVVAEDLEHELVVGPRVSDWVDVDGLLVFIDGVEDPAVEAHIDRLLQLFSPDGNP